MMAYVADPDGPFDVQRVELTFDGIPTGVLLMDDGTAGDAGFRDGFYGLQVPVGGAGLVPAGQYKIGLQAWDMGGHAATVSWPDLVVVE